MTDKPSDEQVEQWTATVHGPRKRGGNGIQFDELTVTNPVSRLKLCILASEWGRAQERAEIAKQKAEDAKS